MTKDDAISRIRKLQAVTRDNGATQAEAASASAMAEAIIAKFGIDRSEIEDAEFIKAVVAEYGDGFPAYGTFVGNVLRNGYSVEVINGKFPSGAVNVVVFGLKADVQKAVTDHPNIESHFERGWSKHHVVNGLHEAVRDSFFMGVLQGILDIIVEDDSEWFPTSFRAPGRELVTTRTDIKKVDDEFKKQHPDIKRDDTPPPIIEPRSYLYGLSWGRGIKIGRVNSGNAIDDAMREFVREKEKEFHNVRLFGVNTAKGWNFQFPKLDPPSP